MDSSGGGDGNGRIGVCKPSTSTEDTGPKVEFAQAYGIMEQRCMPCHVSNPTFPGMKAPPLGIAYDTPEQIKALSRR